MNRIGRRIWFCLKLAVPVVLLSIIFATIDWRKLGAHCSEVSFALMALALVVGYFSQVLIASARWKYVLGHCYHIDVPYCRLVRYFWVGMFLGYFVPANLGMDAYRVMRAAKHGGGYAKNITAILIEKVSVLAGSAVLVIVCYPIIRSSMTPHHALARAVEIIYLAALCALPLCLGVWLVLVPRRHHELRRTLAIKADELVDTVVSRVCRSPSDERSRASVGDLIRPFFHWKHLVYLLLFTLVNRLVSGIGGHFLFLSLGIALPVLVNVFATTLLFIIFTLPISFGTLGVREGSFIVLFGLFGVEKEAALAASFLGLACILLTIATGGLILLAETVFTARPDILDERAAS